MNPEEFRNEECQFVDCTEPTAQVIEILPKEEGMQESLAFDFHALWVCEDHIDTALEEHSPARFGKGIRGTITRGPERRQNRR